MKTKQFLAAVSCQLLFWTAGYAQQASPPAYLQERKSPVMQEVQKTHSKVLIRSQWNGLGGNGIILGLLKDSAFRSELNISDEQYERIQETAKDIRNPQKNPELQKIYEEINSIKASHGPILQNVDEKTKKRYFDLEERVAEITTSTGRDALHQHNIAQVLAITLTPEQKQKMKEVQLAAALSEVSIFPPSMFEALDLTDAQQREMEEIKKKLESELEKPAEDIANRQLAINNKLYDECEKKGHWGISFTILDEEVRKQITDDIRKIGDETESYGKRYAMQFKTKMFDVLTDEQWVCLQNLIDNPSGHVKMMFEKLKEWKKKKGEWQPGPDSWKPGDPIPEGYREQRNERRRFPKAE